MKTIQDPFKANVLGIAIDALNMNTALDRTRKLIRSRGSNYICAASVHGITAAQHNVALRCAYAGAALVIPDGMPLVWAGHRQGHHRMERVTGPDLMLEIFKHHEFAEVTHFLYGGDPGVVEELRVRLLNQFPNARIVGTYTPPFRELYREEELDMEALMSRLKPDIVWVGLGCPKQELFMARYATRWNPRVMIGVGAAFNFHTGRIRDCAPWVKRAGLQWLHRLLQDPKRLWRRYLVANSSFVYRSIMQELGWHFPRTQRVPRTSATSQTIKLTSR